MRRDNNRTNRFPRYEIFEALTVLRSRRSLLYRETFTFFVNVSFCRTPTQWRLLNAFLLDETAILDRITKSIKFYR